MKNNNNASSGGIGFLGLLTLLLIALKCTTNPEWSWFWVLSPLWAPLAIWLIVGLVSLLLALWVKLFSTPQQKEQLKKIRDDIKQNAGKSKWQIRMEQMQEAQKKMAEGGIVKGNKNGII